MVLVVPNQKTGLALVEEKLLNTPLSELMKGVAFDLVKVFLPKFKIETTLYLEKALGEVC